MIRRGFMAALAGLTASPLVRATTPMPVDLATQAMHPPYYGSPIHEEGERKKKWRALNALRRPGERAQRRRMIALALSGGWPPHIAVMESNALRFRAQRAAVWIEAREDRELGFFRRLERQIFGDDA